MASPSDHVLLALTAESRDQMLRHIGLIRSQIERGPPLGFGELAWAATREAPANAGLRASVVAASAGECLRKLSELCHWVKAGDYVVCGTRGLFLGTRRTPARLGLLFPGQGAPVDLGAPTFGYLSAESAAAYEDLRLRSLVDGLPAELVQLAIVLSSLAGLESLRALGIEADLALGHSLGEITALHWAGALDQPSLLALIRHRGKAMTTCASADGAMVELRTDEVSFLDMLEGSSATLACMNSPQRWVASGDTCSVELLTQRAAQRGIHCERLKVGGAFHSSLMAGAVPAFTQALSAARVAPLKRPVFSTVTGTALGVHMDVRSLLARQIVEPVRFIDAARLAAHEADLLVEVGPGRILAHLISEITAIPAVSLRTERHSSRHLLEAAAAIYAAGLPVNLQLLQAEPRSVLDDPAAQPPPTRHIG